MVKKRGLGKSLDALLAYTSPTHGAAAVAMTEDDDGEEKGDHLNVLSAQKEKLSQMSVQSIERGKYQPRQDMNPESLNDLANSIRQQGVLQPLIVRPIANNRYEIIAGERRFRAAQIAGLTEVPVIIRDIPDEAAIAIALIENIQREDLNPIEEAIALDRLIEEFGMTHLQVAEAVGKSRTSVTNLLRLLALPEEVKTLVAEKQIEMGHARTLITLPRELQLETAQMIVMRGLSVRETENVVRRLQKRQDGDDDKDGKDAADELDPNILHLQDHLSKQFKLKVAIQCNQRGRGKVVFHYRNLRELDALIEKMQLGE